MKRIRRSAPLTISLGLLLAGCSLTLSAQSPALSRSEMEAFVYTVIATAGVCVVGAFWVLLMTFTGRTEGAVERLVTTMREHHDDPLAHPAGSANRINPVMQRLDEIEARLARTHDIVVELHAEHRVIRQTEDEVCALIRRKGMEAPRRSSDPPDFDGTGARVE